jgi:hypothetical protein
MYAAYYGREEVLRELFLAGADIDFQNDVRVLRSHLHDIRSSSL